MSPGHLRAGGGDGGTTGGLDPVLVPVDRPEASRRVVLQFPEGWQLEEVVPVILPDASRNPEVTPPPVFRVSALPVMRPEASR